MNKIVNKYNLSLIHISGKLGTRTAAAAPSSAADGKIILGVGIPCLLYTSQTEIYDYLSRLERENLKHPEQSMEQ